MGDFKTLINSIKQPKLTERHGIREINKIIDEKGNSVTCGEEIAELLNNYIVNRGEIDHKKYYDSPPDGSCLKMNLQVDKNTPKIESAEYRGYIFQLKTYRGSFLENVTTKILNDASLVDSLLTEINKSLIANEYPSALKILMHKPLQSKQTEQIEYFNSYSRVGMFTFIMDYIIGCKLRKYNQDKQQYYFCGDILNKWSKFTCNLMDYTMFVQKQRKKSNYVVSLRICFKDYCDVIPTKLLFNKFLRNENIPKYLQNIICSYLLDWDQYTNIKSNGHTYNSNILINNNVLPNTPFLKEVLTCFYLSDMPTNGTRFSYNHESLLVYSGPNLKDLQKMINDDLKNIDVWIKDNRLLLNSLQTDYLLFKPANLPNENITLKIDNNEIIQKQTIRFLGLLIDEELNFEEHTKELENNEKAWFKFQHHFFSCHNTFNRTTAQCTMMYYIEKGLYNINENVRSYFISENDPIMIAKRTYDQIPSTYKGSQRKLIDYIKKNWSTFSLENMHI